MLLYKRLSPQVRLQELADRAAEVQSRLRGFEGDFPDAWPILKENMSLAWQRLRAAVLPSVLAGLPVIFVLAGVNGSNMPAIVLDVGPEWVRSWLFAFFVASGVSALVTKVALRIK